jgi:hypothetical protein
VDHAVFARSGLPHPCRLRYNTDQPLNAITHYRRTASKAESDPAGGAGECALPQSPHSGYFRAPNVWDPKQQAHATTITRGCNRPYRSILFLRPTQGRGGFHLRFHPLNLYLKCP